MPGVRGEAGGAPDAGCRVTFWLDAHLSPDLAAWLGARYGVIAKALNEIGLREADDDTIFAAGR